MIFKKKKLVKRCSVYISEQHQQIIIAPSHINKAGIIYEQEICKTLPKSASFTELGTEVIECLNLFSMKDKNLRETKPTDWPAYKLGKSKSIRTFENEYIWISIDGCNENNLLINIEGAPYIDSELKVIATISFYADKEQIGKRIINVFEACLNKKL